MTERPTSTATVHPDDIRSDLNGLVSRVRTVRTQRRLGNALRQSWKMSAWWLLVGPVLLALGTWLSLWDPPTWPWIAASALGPFVLDVIQGLVIASRVRESRETCLSIVDLQCGLKDRLVSADEFLHESQARDESTPSTESLRHAFATAALHDAVPYLDVAKRHEIEPQARVKGGSRWLLALPLLGALAALWTLQQESSTPTPSKDVAVVSPPPNQVSNDEPRKSPSDTHATPPKDPKREDPSKSPSLKERDASAAEKNSVEDKKQPASKEELRAMESEARAGASADALTRARPSTSLGNPSEHAEKAKRVPQKPKKSKVKSKPVAEVKKPPSKRPEKPEQAGATAGRGSSKGSKSNPIANPWSSKDQAPDEKSDDLEFDEDVDDEFDDSDSRGGMQPNLRDRRPPVNRDLGIGFGNKPNPDANGRGGPGQRKKSRGTASLILGVPIPDHVKGLSGPGTTKVTHERTRPMPERVGPLDARAGTRRSAPTGFAWQPALAPWSRALIRQFFARSDTPNAASPSEE